MSQLIPWRTPFEDEFFPSIWISEINGPLNTAVVNVGWPAIWQVRFAEVLGLKVCDETYDNNARFHVPGNEGKCSYTWDYSPWLSDFSADYAEGVGGSKVYHYVLLGGDFNVEVLAHGEVNVTNVAESVKGLSESNRLGEE